MKQAKKECPVKQGSFTQEEIEARLNKIRAVAFYKKLGIIYCTQKK